MGHDPNLDKGLDFEFTDFGEARQVLDELPAGILERQQMEPGYWLRRRREPSAADRALTGPAVDWLIKLPPGIQPRRTSVAYPRIVNHIASVASDASEAIRTLEELFQDRRGGRRGLPEPVREEMQRLLEHFQAELQRCRITPTAADIEHARRVLEMAGYRVIPPVR